MQHGRIYRKSQSWILSYAVKVLRPDGKVVWANRSKKLAPVSNEYRSEASVRHLAAEILAPLNAKTARPESTDTVIHFLEEVYLPYCKALAASTHNGYKYLLKDLKPHIGNERLRDFGTVEGERLLADFAAEKVRAQTTLKNAKGFLSGAFRYAVRTGVLQFNPMRETLLPKGKPMANGRAYTLKEVQTMLKVLGEPARTCVLVAALTGLRQSEIRGLRWEDYDGKTIQVRRSVWRTHVGVTKTEGSAASIPVLPVLAEALDLRWVTSQGTYIFAGPKGRPLQLPNLTRRVIVPALRRAGIHFSGWHGFRRGLATTLSDLGVLDKVTQGILRHASVETTRKHYIKTSSPQAEKAMEKLRRAFARTENRTEKLAE
jgi:integrase